MKGSGCLSVWYSVKLFLIWLLCLTCRTTVTNLWHLATLIHMDKCNDNVYFGTWTTVQQLTVTQTQQQIYTCPKLAHRYYYYTHIVWSGVTTFYLRQTVLLQTLQQGGYILGSLRWLNYLSQMVRCYLLEVAKLLLYYLPHLLSQALQQRYGMPLRKFEVA